MLRPRIIPCLLVHKKGLVKTVNFAKPKYVGDPINAVKIFNEKEIDELIVLDIDATVEQRKPDYNMIQNLAAECRMPLCYGGGVKSVEQAKKIISLGVEKVALSSIAIENPSIILELAAAIGNQSVVIVLDVKKHKWGKSFEIHTHNGTKPTGKTPPEYLDGIHKLGVGEIVINSIDKDGMMTGYDHLLIKEIKPKINVPLTVLGGAGSLNDIKSLIDTYGVVGAAAGSLFVFKGPYKAVLINYPNAKDKKLILQDYFS